MHTVPGALGECTRDFIGAGGREINVDCNCD